MKTLVRPFTPIAITMLVMCCFASQARGDNDGVTLVSLLEEMHDLDSLARWPMPEYEQRQASSYNRQSVAPDKPGWFADSDGHSFIRTREHKGQTEWVLMEHEGPGCLTRIWTPFFYYGFNDLTGPNVRIYLDGADEPVIDAPLIDLVTVKSFVREPFSQFTARAGDLYLPIPYGKSCIVTMPKKPFFNIINYRVYAKGTKVETFSRQRYEAAKIKLESVGDTLLDPPAPTAEGLETITKRITAGESLVIPTPQGPAAVRYLEIHLAPTRKESNSHLRSTVLTGTFDGKETIWCPVGDFFGCADAIHPYKTFAREVSKDGKMICRWVMPYRQAARLKLKNLGDESIGVRVRIATGEWQWDERSMHFHATWRPDDVVKGSEFQDWNFVEIKGRGVFVGDQWTVANPNGSWWGEGDEKIYIDDDFEKRFPSHFGTGTEDYYGWAGGRVPTRDDEFSHPFLANVRVGGLDGWTKGYNICVRQRGLDAIPFRERFSFNLEASFGTDIRNPWNLLGYSGVTWWYARSGVTHNRPPKPEETAKSIITIEALEQKAKEIRLSQVKRLEGAIEFESLQPTTKSKGVSCGSQIPAANFRPHRMSGGAHFFVAAREVGDFVEFTLAEQYKPRELKLHLVRSYDFGIVQIYVNGEKFGKPVDLYESDPVTIKVVDLGMVKPKGNIMTVRVELVGKNPKSLNKGSYFGLDCVVLNDSK